MYNNQVTIGGFHILIANKQVAELFADEDVLKIPISVIGIHSVSFFILVIKREIDCIDRQKSIFKIWEEGNDIRPDKAGQYRNFQKMIIDPNKAEGLDVFRIKGFNVALIVSEKIKHGFEEKGFESALFLRTVS